MLALTACLAAPPGSGEDGGRPPAPAGDCAPGSEVDLVHGDRVAVAPWAAREYQLAGLAVFANPGDQPARLDELSASAGDEAGVSVDLVLDGDAIELAPGEAKGALGDDAAALVAPELTESWTDRARPSLSADLAVPDAGAFGDDDAIELAIEVRAGDRRFPLRLTLELGGTGASGLPLSAVRVGASCD